MCLRVGFPQASSATSCFTTDMSRENLLILFGTVVALSPFLGLPSRWLMWLLLVLGAGIVFLGYATKMQMKPKSLSESTSEILPA